MKNFKVLRRGFNWPIFIILFATLVVSGFFIFINNVKAATFEVTPTYTAERDIVVKAADRIIDLQHTDGSWDWVVTNKTGPTGTTYLNISGVTGELLIDAYKLTGDSTYLDGAKNTGDYLINQVGPKVASSQRHNAFNIVFLYHLADIANDNQYKSQGDTILNHILYEENYFSLNNGSHCADDGIDGCIASELVEGIKNLRSWAGNPSGIIVWDLYHFVEAAQRAGETSFANEMADEIEIYISQEEFDNTIQYYDLGLSGAIVALAKADRDYSSYLSALLSEQETDGFFSNLGSEPIQTTAYALMFLKYAGEDSAAYDAFSYLIDNFGYNDDIDGWQEDDGKEYSEVTSEAGQAIFDYIYVEDIYYTIQDAIDAATSGDTINVTAGTYDESVVINKNNLTISGDDSQPAITGGLKFDTDLTGLSLNNFNISGNAVVGGNSIVRMYGAITDLFIDNCVFDGEDITDRNGFSGGQLEGDVTITNSEFKDILGWALLDSRSGSGGDGSAMGTVTFANNYVYDVEGSIVFRGLSTDWTDNVYIYGNTFKDVGKGGTSSHWAAFEVNRAQNVEIYNNIIRDIVVNSWGEGQAMQLWQIGTVEIYNNTIEDNYQGIAILKWPTGETYDLSNISIFNNSFSDNEEYALSVEDDLTGGPINARSNYWGDETGPAHATTNISGLGDEVSDNVEYSPWYTNSEMTSLKAPTILNETGNTVLLTQSIDIIANNITVSMPAGISITATASWEGIIDAPSIETVALDTPPPESGHNTTIDTIIEIGYSNIKLVFDKAVKILIPNQAGKRVGYVRPDEDFQEITNVCSNDIQPTDDSFLPPEGDCKRDVDNDLVVWTKHFTQFIVYSYSPIIITPTFRAETPPEPEPEEEPSPLSEEAQKLDTNKDEKIDDLDLKELFANWGSIILDNIADFNNDSKVDVFDFNLLMVHWTE